MGAGMNERSCAHMVDTESPCCWLNLYFPRDCHSCSRYLPDEARWDDHREKVWQQFALGNEIPESARYKQNQN